MSEYRIVRDGFAGYEVQIRRWWWPFWSQIGVNTHLTVERAQVFAEKHARKPVKYLGRFITPPHTGKE